MYSTKDQLNRIKLYCAALSYLGTDASPNDDAPDEYGCADSVSKIILNTFPGVIRGSVSTTQLYQQLKLSSGFYRVLDFRPGDIIISPTGYGNGSIANGHVGIIGEGEEIMSNTSSTGLWTQNYTLKTWVDRYRNKGGYPLFIFRKT